MMAAVATALGLGAAPARAQAAGGAAVTPAQAPSTSPAPIPGRVELAYKVDNGVFGCDSEAMFRRMVANVLDGLRPIDPFVLTGPPTHVLDVLFLADPPGARSVLELREVTGKVVFRRGIFDRSCRPLSEYLAIAVSLDIFVALAPAPPSPPPPPKPECDPCSERKESKETQRRLDAIDEKLEAQDEKLEALEKKNVELKEALEEAKRKMDLTYALSTGLLMTANLTSNVGPGVWVGGEGRSGPLALGLEIRAVIPSPVFVGPYDFDLGQVVGLITPCGRYSYFFGCVVAGAGVQTTRDSDYDPGNPAAGDTKLHPVLQLGGRVGAEVPFAENRLAVRAWAEVLYGTPPTLFTYTGTGFESLQPDVSAFFGIGFVVKFGDEKTR